MPPLASRKQYRKMRFTHGTIHNLSPFSLQPMPPPSNPSPAAVNVMCGALQV